MNPFTQTSARCRWPLLAVLFLAASLVACSKHAEALGESTSSDPEVNAHLAQLTHELRHAMVGQKLNRDFDEFAALRHLTVPPPPEGKKYAISEKWKVVLVDK
ncbi:MAG TPA: hypothetical protein VH413_17035 [Verrucomicrobiae bacterium]|jgi:hypothetical protein|nr:hypothetical protein [Verrucomicrobiae bacterium]